MEGITAAVFVNFPLRCVSWVVSSWICWVVSFTLWSERPVLWLLTLFFSFFLKTKQNKKTVIFGLSLSWNIGDFTGQWSSLGPIHRFCVGLIALIMAELRMVKCFSSKVKCEREGGNIQMFTSSWVSWMHQCPYGMVIAHHDKLPPSKSGWDMQALQNGDECLTLCPC